MTMIKVFMCFLALLGVALCQNCDFTVVHQCMQTSNSSADPMAGMKAAMENCFTSAGCTLPQKPSNPVEECEKQVHETIKNDIQTCVQAQFPSFNFPAWNHSHQEGGWRGGNDNGEKHGDQGFQAILNQSCPDSTSAKNVQSCTDNLRSSMQQQLQNAGSGARFGNPSSMKSQMCAKKASCLNQLSSTCQTQWTQIKSQLCTCTQNEISAKSAALETQIQACWSSSSGTTAQTAASGQGWNRNRGGGGGRSMGRGQGQGKMGRVDEHGPGRSGEKGLQKMADWFCNDPCANN